jgi:hypothetical protein
MYLRTISGIALLGLLSACDSVTESSNELVAYPEAGSPAAQRFQEKCTGCHNAPQPSVHTARMWPSVLQRMQMRMKAKGVQPLNKTELGEILDYLQRHAAQTELK